MSMCLYTQIKSYTCSLITTDLIMGTQKADQKSWNANIKSTLQQCPSFTSTSAFLAMCKLPISPHHHWKTCYHAVIVKDE